ncbi:SusC/RagA family TonB-linked outer membrane protein [Spirosoma fluviale]|uniref:TonB-linked outer membrane protein, SusC/RagA family n=1 Tax=Spirosoma fluviale TaxID=1597977 RepID=A0A286FIF8_9BACT|nr:TonB-dependent receptor [Spirosoma fluviale]SOD83010.1 TonB-linked outer membrane protein, SusC/RagA family [Spirosoma fluviale]
MQKMFTQEKLLLFRVGASLTNADVSRRFAFCSLFLLSLLVSVGAYAQTKVSGKVVDAQGLALPGVSIVVKGTTMGTVSAAQGDYTLNLAKGNETLVFSYIGFLSQEVPANNRSTINITLASDDKMLNEVIVVGYGEQKKETVTGSVATVKGSELIKSPAVNLSNSIAGRMPGVIATNASGEPGYDGAAIKIRGSNTLGNNDALIVIDGVPARAGGIDRLNPNDIESISVLKDASAAIYGSRAANGVILVTTKRGKTGKPDISYSFNQGFSQATVIPKMATASQYAELNNEINVYNLPSQYWKDANAAFKATGSYTRPDNGSIAKAAFTPDDMKKYQDGSDPWGHPNTDWFGAALKTWSPQTRHTLQLVGGNDNVKYLTSLNYQNQDGYYKNSATGYKQYDFRINLDAKVNKYINTVVGVVGRQENRFFPTVGAGAIFRMLMRGYPNKPAFWPNGQPAPDIENGQQPVLVTTDATGYDKDTRYYVQSNASVTVTNPWIAGLKFVGSVALDKYIQQGKTWQTPWFVYSWDYTSYDANKQPLLQRVQKGPAQATLNQYTNDQFNSLLSGILSYDHVFGGNHALTLLAGITKEQSNSSGFSGFRRYFASTAIDQLFAGGSAEKNANTTAAWERARMSYFGRAGYNYKEKYLAEFLWRYDGSYMFPSASRWGFFPGVTAGWRISEEEFFKKSMPAVSSLKLRASWGQLGNDQVYFNGALREYDYLPTYAYGDVVNSNWGYVTGGQVSQTLYENGVPNPTLTWEVANNADIGLEGSLLNGKIFFEFDVFQNKRSNILWRKSASIPQTTGMTLPATNIGKVTNKGYEFNIGYNGQTSGGLKYSVSVNGGYAKNEITFWDETPGAPEWQRSTGKPIPSNVNDPNQQNGTLLYQYEGIFSTQADIDANKLDYSGVGASLLRPGDMKLKDINGDGKINGDDRVRADRNNQPRFQGGLNASLRYKNFDLSVLVQASAGGQIFLQTESGTIGNFLAWSYDNRWTVDNPSTVNPRIVDRSNQYFSNGTSYWLKSTDYARLKNLELGYTLPSTIGSKIGLNNLRVYVNGLNLITYAPAMKGLFDPESTSGSAQYYPQARVINTGVSVSF